MKKIVLINLVILVVLLLTVELLSSLTWYNVTRGSNDSLFATVGIIKYLKSGVEYEKATQVGVEQKKELAKARPSPKFEKIIGLRKDSGVYPAYLFDPQLHVDLSVYHLAHPIESTIVYCNENNYWTIFDTDEIGFRNPVGQIGKEVDFLFIGDSFTEGACVKNEDTFAGVFRKNDSSVLNLGRGGSGPLFQLAVLREFGDSVEPETVVWFVFTGNDLQNLREEKATRLFAYLEDDSYTQDLVKNKHDNSNQLKRFLEQEISYYHERQERNLPNPLDHFYGETLDIVGVENKEVFLLKKVAAEMLKTTNRLGARLYIVLINHHHPNYDYNIQDLVTESVTNFAQETGTGYLVLERKDLIERKVSLFSSNGRGTHFSPQGYREMADKLIQEVRK